LTIIERKLLSRYQRRKGPYRFIFQAILDGIKGLTKERIKREENKYYNAVWLNLFISLVLFELLPISYTYRELNINLDFLFFIILSALNFYPIIYTGLSSNNKYTLFGVIRGINQLISYEINITLILISIIYSSNSFNIINIYISQIDTNNLFMFPFFFFFFFSFLAESNRIPFDLLEAESEIVAGRVTEYSSLEFTLIYISEYLMIFINSILLSLFFSFPYYILFIVYLISRALLPRYSYNDTINLNWISFLPLVFSLLSFYKFLL
jgi:NADH-quinone oxidoreductase subunit H